MWGGWAQVLIGRAALYDSTTLATCYFAILTVPGAGRRRGGLAGASGPWWDPR